MPTSSKEGKDIIRNWVTEFSSDIHTVLDLGVGAGTYKAFYADKKNRPLKDATWIGIEAWKPYIIQFKLEEYYDKIINADIREVDYESLDKIDLVFIGDVLEHISKDDAVVLIKKLLCIANKIIISIPIIFHPQGEINNNPFEVHVKEDWSHLEMLETFPEITKSWSGNIIGVYLLERSYE